MLVCPGVNKSMKTTPPIWFNFGSLGYPSWLPISQLETQLMLAGAEQFVDNNPKEVCDYMLECKRASLMRRAAKGLVSEEWVTESLLVIAMQGLMGYEIPEVLFEDDK